MCSKVKVSECVCDVQYDLGQARIHGLNTLSSYYILCKVRNDEMFIVSWIDMRINHLESLYENVVVVSHNVCCRLST